MKKTQQNVTKEAKTSKPNFRNYQSIGLFLRDYRIHLRSKNKEEFTQLSIAKKCGYTSSQHISNIERGLTLPSLSLSVKLMKFYGIEREAMYELFLKYRENQYKKVFLAKKAK